MGLINPETLAAAQIIMAANTIGQKEGVGYKHDLSPAAGVAPYTHGTTGLFNTPGVDPRIFSAMMLPISGLIDALPIMPPGSSMSPGSEYGGYDTPFYDTVTGVTAGALDNFRANQPDAPCDDPPEPGLLKLCTLTAPYGRFYGKIRAVDLQRVGRLTNWGEPTGLNMVNTPANQGGFLGATPFGDALRTNIDSNLNARLFEAAVSFRRGLANLVYTGDPLNNAAGGGYKEFQGLNMLINTGNKIDVFTSNVCTALNSTIVNFGNVLLTAGTPSIVQQIDGVYYNLEFNAIQQGLDPVEWALVMRSNLFNELTKIWSTRYYEEALVAMSTFTNGRAMLDARDATTYRDEMRNNFFLPIRGKRVRVIIDDTIAENNSTNAALPAGRYSSDIYFVPLTVLGSVPVTYIEPFNYNAQQINNFKNFMGLDNSIAFMTSDGGRFLWWSHRTGTCLDYRWVMEFRIILRTPQLAARITNVAYQPTIHTQDWNTDSSYHTNGGRTNTPASSYYVAWTGSPVVIPNAPNS